MFKHLVWDWNGTLLDDAAACVAAINALLERRHLPRVTHQQYLDIFDFPVRNYYLQLGFDFTKDDWSRVAEEYHAVYAETSRQSPLRAGTRDALQALKTEGITLSVLSACEIKLLHRMMDERGVLGFFDHVYGLSDLYAHSKVDLGHSLLNDSGLSRADALLVGDTTHDYEVAQAIGIRCLLMTGGHQSPTKLKGCGCPVTESLGGVLEFALNMSASFMRRLWIAGIVAFWLVMLAWLVFFEAYPGLFDRTTGGYRNLLSQGVMVMDQWMKITFQGKPIGYSNTKVDAIDADGVHQYVIKNLTVLNLNVMGKRQRIAVTADSTVDSAYRLQTFSFVISSSGYSVDVKGRRKHGAVFAVTVHGVAAPQRLEVTIPDDAVLYSPLTEMTLRSLTPGKQVTLRVFNPVTLSAQSIVIRALRQETITIRKKPVAATVLAALVEGMETLSWIDGNGAVLRQETTFGWVMESCDAREALASGSSSGALDADMLTSLAVPISGPVAKLPSAHAATLRLSGAALSHESLESQRQSVLSITGTVAEIRVQAEQWPDAGLPLSPVPTNMAPWLAATAFVQSDDPRMLAKARQIVAGATTQQQAARAIYDWVFTKVAKEPTVSLPSALDVLLRPEGDCNEHTYLFVGLARAAGLPAKIRVGLTLHNGLLYYHAWPSVYLGRWVDMDPTLGQPVVGADHISLFEGELAEQMKLMGVIGRLKVDILAVEE